MIVPHRPRKRPAVVLALLVPLAACAAAPLAVAKRNLDVQTRLSEPVFLEPARRAGRMVWVEVRNGTDKPELDLEARLRARLAERGYRLAADPRQADLVLQASVLQAGRVARTAGEGAYRSGSGSAVAGGLVGGAAGYGASRGGTAATIGAGLAGAAAGSLADAFVQDVAYAVVVELEIGERAPTGLLVGEAGGAGTTTVTTELRRHRTRVVSTANRVNLAWEDAAPPLLDGLSRAVAGVL